MSQVSAGETLITAMVLSQNSLYTSFGVSVRLWDLRKYASVGLLTGKHQAQIMCMAATDIEDKHFLVTGSKDHYIKV
jgi:kinesin family protein 4/21/27